MLKPQPIAATTLEESMSLEYVRDLFPLPADSYLKISAGILNPFGFDWYKAWVILLKRFELMRRWEEMIAVKGLA
jgi:hypothetical protein